MEYSELKKRHLYAGTGKIMGFENKRGIHSLIRLLDDMKMDGDTE